MEEAQKVSSEDRVVIPLSDRSGEVEIYSALIHRWGLISAVVFGVLFAALAYAIVEGPMAIAGLGQLAASGVGVAVFLSAACGIAVGFVIGGAIAMSRIGAR